MLHDLFAHHGWANLRVIEACTALTPAQLQTTVSGTFGTILDTVRHIVGADASYLNLLTAGRTPVIDEEGMALTELRTATERHIAAWSSLVAQDPDTDMIVARIRDDGSQSQAPLGIRLAQALHHGTDHRSQVCTALTTLGIAPPEIDVWAYGQHEGRLVEIPRAS